MERLNAAMAPAPVRPVKVLQFGEGNFLRAFVDYMIDIANEKSDFNGSVALVKPIQMGTLFPAFKEQDYRYTVMLRGLVDGQAVEQTRVVTSVADAVDAYADYAHYADYAKLPSLRFIVSNTTEAGIVLDETDEFSLCPPKSYPGKLTKFLFERAEAFDYAQDKGLIILPVELIDDNGIMLKKCVKTLAKQWFLLWSLSGCFGSFLFLQIREDLKAGNKKTDQNQYSKYNCHRNYSIQSCLFHFLTECINRIYRNAGNIHGIVIIYYFEIHIFLRELDGHICGKCLTGFGNLKSIVFDLFHFTKLIQSILPLCSCFNLCLCDTVA